MVVIFSAHQKLGNRVFKKGQQVVPDHFAHNRAFHALVQSGVAQILPRDAVAQKVQMSRDAKAFHKAKVARKASKSAQAASSANPYLSSAAGLAQALPTPAKPILTGSAAPVSAPAEPVTALIEDEDEES